MKKKIITRIAIITGLLIAGTQYSKAQLNNFQSIYFQNQYLANPAMAGLDKGLNLDLGYQKQWTTVPGSPKLQNVTADYNAGGRVGLGVIVNNDNSGLISKTRVLGTFAYHIPFAAGEKLNFGVSLGINDNYLDYGKIVGDQADIAVPDYNQRSVDIDGDLGAAYTNDKGINIQATLPNLKDRFFKNGDEYQGVDQTTFFTAASYKILVFNHDSNFLVEPKVAFRGIKGFQNILDAGCNLTLLDYGFSLSGMYHTSKSATVGLGLDLASLGLLFAYTNNTGSFRSYAANTFEFGVKLKLFNK